MQNFKNYNSYFDSWQLYLPIFLQLEKILTGTGWTCNIGTMNVSQIHLKFASFINMEQDFCFTLLLINGLMCYFWVKIKSLWTLVLVSGQPSWRSVPSLFHIGWNKHNCKILKNDVSCTSAMKVLDVKIIPLLRMIFTS